MDDNRRQKKRKSSHNSKIRRILRIRYTDPDATESSSDENHQKPKKIKRFVRDIPLPHINIDETSNESCKYLKNDIKVDVKREPATKKYKGVRMRKWGSWASEIRNPMLKSGREWIGTFSTAEEASQAYQKRSLEIKEEMANAEKMKNSGNSQNNDNVNNIIMATNQGMSNSAYFVSADSLCDSKSNIMFHTPSSQLPELDIPDCNLIDVGNVSSNEAKVDVLGGGGAKLGGEFVKLDGPDLSVLNMQPLSLPPLPPPPVFVRTPNPRWFEDINICGIDDKDPCGIPSFNFADFGADDITYGIENPLFL